MSDAGQHGGDTPKKYTDEELDAMSRDDLVKLGTNLDGVDVVYRRDRWSVKGTRAEKRAERNVAFWFGLAGVSAIAFIAIYLFWPWEYAGAGDENYGKYSLYTPLIGLTMGLAILGVGIGAVQFTKKFIPEEVSIQDRHDGGSTEVDVARSSPSSATPSTRPPSPAARSSSAASMFGGGALGVMMVMPLGGLIKNPWAKGDDSPLWVSGWTPNYPGETIYLRRDTGRPEDIVLVRPEDLDAGAHGNGLPVPRVRPWRRARAARRHCAASVTRSCSSASARRTPRVSPSARARRASTTAITSPTRRSAPTSVAPPRCTSSRPTVFCAPATSRSSTH